MKKYCLLFFMSFTYYFLNAQTYPEVHNYRPRIYIDSSRFAYLSANKNIGECGETYTRFINAVYGNWYNDPELYLLGEDSTKWTWTFSSKWASMQGNMVPAIYKITKDPLDLKRCRFLAEKFIAYYDTLNFDNYDWYSNENLIRAFSDNAGILLDWCYQDFSIDLRRRFVKIYYKINQYFMDTYIISSAGDSYVSSHNAWNTIYANQNSLVLYNADELSVGQKDTVKSWYDLVYEKWIYGFMPCYGYYRDDDGGWNWTAAYSMWSLVDQFQLFENMEIATDKDFYHDLPWVENSINQYWYFIQPNGWTINWGDGFTQMSADRVMHIHAREFNDPKSQYLSQYYSKFENISWTWPLFQNLLYKDFEMGEIHKPSLPLNWWSDKVGLSISRTSWDSSSAMVWFFNSPTKKAAHEHRDNNTFCVYKYAPQIINSGYYYYYGNSHYANYYQRTIAHNCVVVYDSTEKFTYNGNPASNDGGQQESATLMNYNDIFEAQFNKGKWLQFASGDNYCYNFADATLSYDTNKLNKFYRKVLFYKPDIVIVLDQIYLKNTETKQRNAKFILHFQNKPEINGENINTKVAKHIETYNGKDIFQANGGGNVAVRTLLPENTTTTRIGGEGYEFYVDGINYPVEVEMDSINTTPGKWRIEVSPNKVKDTLAFLNVISIGDSIRPAKAQGVLHCNSYSIAADLDSVIFFFFNDFQNKDIHRAYDVIGNRFVNLFFADLASSSTYALLINGQNEKILNTDENGILQYKTFLSQEINTIELHRTIIDESVSSDNSTEFTIAPNPNTGQFKISFNDKIYRNVKISIFDLSGYKIYEGEIENNEMINLENQALGTYLIKLESNNVKKIYKVSIAK
jgi:hypothetical protein